MKAQMDRSSVNALLKEIDLWLASLLYVKIVLMDLETEDPFFGSGRAISSDSLMERMNIHSSFGRWWKECLRILFEAHLIEVVNGKVHDKELNFPSRKHPLSQVARALNSDDQDSLHAACDQLWQDWQMRVETYSNDPEIKTAVTLADQCLRSLDQIIRGHLRATDILFSDTSMDRVGDLYQRNQVSDYYNRILARVCKNYLKKRIEKDPKAKISILEIGAGTGGTTALVLPELDRYKNHIQSYFYTDLSKAFLLHAQKSYGDGRSYLNYEILNIEKNPATQGIPLGSFDLVIATNVLHATRNMTETLKNVRSYLRPMGLAMINERIEKTILSSLTFGLLDGWWCFDDEEVRIPGSPLIEPDEWVKLLKGCGFGSVVLPERNKEGYGHQIFIAENSGPPAALNHREKEALTQPVKSAETVNQKPSLALNQEIVVKDVVYSLAKTLQTISSDIDTQMPFSDYGIDSILGVSFIKELNARLGIRLNTSIIFDHSNVCDLSTYIVETYQKSKVQYVSKERGSRHPLTLSKGSSKKVKSASKEMGSRDPLTLSKGSSKRVQNVSKEMENRGPLTLSQGSSKSASPDPLKLIKQQVVSSLARTLQIPASTIDALQPFSDYGIDSILGVHFVKDLNKQLSIRMNTSIIFDYSTVEALTDYIQQTFAPHRPGENPKMTEPHHTLPKREKQVPMGRESRRSKPQQPISQIRDSIAIIGMSGQVPGAEDVLSFWHNLINGKDGIHRLPPDYLTDLDGYQWGGALRGRAYFDPTFFKITPREAESMNPHQRLIMQEGWRAIEDAGLNPKSLNGKNVGIYIGAEPTGYFNESFTGSSDASIASRLSYFLNLKGPALVVNTGCSSSGVALHLACENLRHGESDLAIAGGVYGHLAQSSLCVLAKAGMLSPTGECHTFDASANGTVLSEGVGVVLLKRLSDAIRDEDHIYGTIEASGTNQDGMSNGVAAPNGSAQEALIVETYKKFSINPEEISYVEAHGTGTKLGDPVEANALVRGFRTFTERESYCNIGSAKSSIGHASASAGVIGLIKILLSMRYEALPGLLHYHKLNPLIEFEASPFFIGKEKMDWPQDENHPRMAALNSFGHSGTNAHLVVKDYMDQRRGIGYSEEPVLVPFSAKTAKSLRNLVEKFIKFLDFDSKDRSERGFLANLAYTMQVGREPMAYRLAISTSDLDTLILSLKGFLNEEEAPGVWSGHAQGLNDLYDDDDYQALLSHWLSKGKVDKIASVWVQGATIDWTILGLEGIAKRIPLPTYAFAQETYWSSRPSLQKPHDPQTGSITPANAVMSFKESWSPVPVSDGESTVESILCFVSNEDQKNRLLQYFRGRNQGINFHFVSIGESFHPSGDDETIIRPDHFDDYSKTLQSIMERWSYIDAILYLWPMEEASYLECYGPIVHLIQALAAAKVHAGRLLLCGAARNERELCFLESWIGFERSLSMVMPKPNLRAILFFSTALEDGSTQFEHIWSELHSPAHHSCLYRDGVRYEQKISPLAVKKEARAFKEGGCYLITGGLGGLGYLVAESLARNFPVKLILNGRSMLSEGAKKKLAHLKSLGSEAVYIRGDIGNSSSIRKAIREMASNFGPINGVIHSAGVDGGVSIFDKSVDQFNQVVHPKVQGTEALRGILEPDHLDFICHFSSSSAILGDFGACDYAVGNRFQMADAIYNEKTIAITWPLWRDGGMGFSSDDQTKLYLKSSGQSLLETREGLEIFEQCLLQGSGQVLVLSGDPDRMKAFLSLTSDQMALAHFCLQREPDKEPGSLEKAAEFFQKRSLDADELNHRVLQDLTYLTSQHIRLSEEHLDPSQNFADFGFDSISLAEFAAVLAKHFQLDMTPSIFFAYSTLQKLASFLVDDYREVLENFYDMGQAPGVEKPSQTDRFETRSTNIPPSHSGGHKFAVVGMSGRFPGARNVDEMWDVLSQGRCTISEIPEERFRWQDYFQDISDGSPLQKDKSCSKWSGFIPGIDEFDPLFFEISPLEAEGLDPRQRLLLQESWNALEDAAFGPSHIERECIGMFVGVEEGEYHRLVQKGSITANHSAILASRLAYFLDLSGPAMAINTACSSSLVALHQACQSIRAGDCSAAIVAGANTILTPEAYVGMSQAGMLSPDGKCYAFDRKANGLVPGEAVVALVVKDYQKAIQDGDSIHGVICGSGVNYDGKTNGITAPNGGSQFKLIKSVHEKSGISADEVTYVVTHGTGTKLGDPVEVNGLAKAFKGVQAVPQSCALTSCKSNFGHTFAASGLVSVVNLIQALKHETIPASLFCDELNDFIRWQESPLYVNTEKRPWLKGVHERIGAVSSFGMSGTNAHMLLTEAEIDSSLGHKIAAKQHLLLLSAKTKVSLEDKMKDLYHYLESHEDVRIADVAYTLMVGRFHFNVRCGILVEDREDALRKLRGHLDGSLALSIKKTKKQKVPRSEKTTWDDKQGLLSDYLSGDSIHPEHLYSKDQLKHIRRCHLPTYPFSRESYWGIEQPKPTRLDARTEGNHELAAMILKEKTDDGFEYVLPLAGSEGYLLDHVVAGVETLPGVVYLDFLHVVWEKFLRNSREDLSIENIAWVKTYTIDKAKKEHPELRLKVDALKGSWNFKMYSISHEQEEQLHAYGTMRSVKHEMNQEINLPTLCARLVKSALDTREFYQFFAEMGLFYGPSFRCLQEVYTGPKEVLSKLSGSSLGMMDAAMQGIFALGADLDSRDTKAQEMSARVPYALDRLGIYGLMESTMWAWIRYQDERQEKSDLNKVNIDLINDCGQVISQMIGLTLLPLPSRQPPNAVAEDTWGPSFEQRVEGYVCDLFADVLKIPRERIDAEEPLEKYGIDSLLIVNLTTELEKTFSSLPKTLFFEYQTLKEIGGYFIEFHLDTLKQHLEPSYPHNEKPSGKLTPLTQDQTQDTVNLSTDALDIAIIGLSGSYPESEDLEAFWQNLENGRNCISEVPSDRWEWRAYYSEDRTQVGKHFSRYGGFLKDIDKFDSLFFNISPREAEVMDPQERLFLEHAWKCFEDAGYRRQDLKKDTISSKVGVYVGVMYGEYQLLGVESSLAGKPAITSSSYASIANRVSYLFNLHGPSMTIDSMCSSSLSSIHLACQDLIHGQSKVALAGGVNVSVHPNKYFMLSSGQFISSRGACESFGSSGDGYIPGEGVGCVLLKPLRDAERDRDHIYGVIKGSALGHGGKTNGYSVPNPNAQEMVITEAMNQAGISPEVVSYIEAHGTGTQLGDPIEIRGLTKAYQKAGYEVSPGSGTHDPCYVGSVKSNIGHCESAAGIASLTKVLLQMKHQKLVPSLHSQELNPKIDFSNTPFVVNQELREWQVTSRDGITHPRTAAISSFGAGGSNAHMILQEYS